MKDHALRVLSRLTGAVGVRHLIRHCVQRGLVPRSVWTRLPIARDFVVTMDDDRHFWYSSSPHDFVGRSLFWKGLDGYEPETTSAFAHLAERARTVVDIGANTGLYSLLACASNPGARVIAFEPVPRVIDRLRREVELNGWQDRCETVCAAVSDRDGTLDFHVPLGGLPHSASLDPKGFHQVNGRLVQTPVVSLDSFCAAITGIDLIKIDVEGFEDAVLSGMSRVLAADHPAVIFEVLDDGPAEKIESILERFGYELFGLDTAGVRPIARIVPDQTLRCRNFVAVARPDHRDIMHAL